MKENKSIGQTFTHNIYLESDYLNNVLTFEVDIETPQTKFKCYR